MQEWLLATANSMSLGTNDRRKKGRCLGQNVSLKMKRTRLSKGSSAFREWIICVLTALNSKKESIKKNGKRIIFEDSDRPLSIILGTQHLCAHNEFNTLIFTRNTSNLLLLIWLLAVLTSILTGSMVLMCTLGAEEDRSRCPNWFRWSSSAGRRGCGIGMDFEGEGLGRIGGLRNKVKEKEDLGLQMASNAA